MSVLLVVLMLSSLLMLGAGDTLVTSSAAWTPTAAIGTVVEPGPPTNLTATPGDGQVHLVWTAPAYNGGATIEYYVVFQDEIAVANVTGMEATITGLTNGVSYDLSVAAHNEAGTGIVSETVSATPYASVAVPGPPSGLTAIAGSGQVQLTWAAPSNDGGAPVTGYVLYWTPDQNAGFSSINVAGVSYLYAGLDNDRTYQFKVAAVNSVGEGGATEVVSVTTPLPSVLPSEVIGLVADANDTAIELTWSAPTNDGGSAITGYMIYRGTSEGDLKLIATVNGTSFVDDGAEAWVRYYYEVYAVNANGMGAAAEIVDAMMQVPVDGPLGGPSVEYLFIGIGASVVLVLVAAFLYRRLKS